MASTKPGSASQLVFLENRAQVYWVKQSLPLNSTTKLVALTAEALQALEECTLPHNAVSEYADTRQLASVEEQFNLDSFSLAQEIESFIAERYAAARFDGPGFLSGQGYYIQYSVSALATRAFLMREAIQACSPCVVTVFEGDIDPWFLGDGYTRNLLLDVVGDLALKHGFRFEVVSRSTLRSEMQPGGLPKIGAVVDNLQTFCRRVHRYARGKVPGLIKQFFPNAGHSNGLDGMRLLMAGSLGHDWAPVLAALRSAKGVECFAIDGLFLDSRQWTYHYASSIRRLWGGPRYDLECGSPRVDEAETRTISNLFDDWLRLRPTSPELNVLGMNLFSTLTRHLRAVTCLGPALARHADLVADRAMEIARPHAVCFFAIPWLPAKRLAYHARQRRIPVVCYQHGGIYGTHVSPKNEQIEAAHADYFLTYGEGIKPRVNPAFPVRALYISVGSARLASIKAKDSDLPAKVNRPLRVIWIAEYSTRNTLGGTFQVEDTERYLLQKQCLEILSDANNLRVTFRPYSQRMDWVGTIHWLKRASFRSIWINSFTPMDKLIRQSDVVITDASSNTVWNEVIALQKPLILYCDPNQTCLLPHFTRDLERACCWCRSRETLVATVRRLVVDGDKFVAELRDIDTTSFVRNYVLHDRQCVPRILSFLNRVCRSKQSVDEWEKDIAVHGELKSSRLAD